MDGRLKMASQSGDIDLLYRLIMEDGELLDHITRLPFVDTPLHIAASEGHVQFAMEIMRLQPSFARKSNQDGFSPMHLALQSGKTRIAIRLLDADKSLVRVQGREGVTPLHYAAKEGDMELLYVFLSACPKSLEDVTIRNETPLHIALKNDKIEAFEVLLRWLSQVSYEEVHQLEKKMLNWKDEDGNTLLHIATLRNQPQAVMLLLTSEVDVNSKNLAGWTPLDIIQHQQPLNDRRISNMLSGAGALEGSSLPSVRTFTYYKSTDQRLKQAAQEGDIGGLYALIQEDSYILERINQVPFVDTPLHIAVSAGHTDFSMEMMRLKPEFARKQNPEGFSAMHLALKQGKTHTLLFLLSVYRDLVRVKGRDGKTLLHYAAEIGNVDLLANFLAASPESIIDLTIRKETALHLAAKNDKLEALEVLLGWLQHVNLNMILQWTDDEGNTVLHIAILKKKFQAVGLLIKRVDINVKNLAGLTAMDISYSQEPLYTEIRSLLLQRGALRASSLPNCPTLADSLRKEMSLLERWVMCSYLTKRCLSNENRNSLLVVAVLIATATFQAVLSPPAGMQRDYFTPHSHKTSGAASNSTGEPNVPSNFGFHSLVAWNCFLALNTMAFLTSISEIWFHLPHGYHFLMKLVLPLLVCYMISLSLTTPVPGLMPVFFILIFLSQLKSVVRNLFFKRSLDVKLSLMKYCPSLHREIKV